MMGRSLGVMGMRLSTFCRGLNPAPKSRHFLSHLRFSRECPLKSKTVVFDRRWELCIADVVIPAIRNKRCYVPPNLGAFYPHIIQFSPGTPGKTAIKA